MRRAVPTLVQACVAGFVALETGAMALYPGGTWWDRAAVGHRFWENFLCDLEWQVALGGRMNPGAELAEGAMLLLVAAIAAYWALAPHWPRAVRALGWTSVGGMVAVAILPSERYGALHGLAVMAAGGPGLAAALLTTHAQRRCAWRATWPLGAALLVVATLDLGLYVHTYATGGPGTKLVPALQKIALALLLAWLVVGAQRARGGNATDAVAHDTRLPHLGGP